MRVDTLAIVLRPRTMAEAADLGQCLVQQHAHALWRGLLPLWLMLLVLASATVEIATWLPSLIVFVGKPWLDRALLHVLSRAVFGQATRGADLWAARSALFGRGLGALLLARLSPWRAFTQPLWQLEGQRGRAALRRRRVLLSGRRGPALGLQLLYAHLELVLVSGVVSLLMWFLPDRLDTQLWSALTSLARADIALAVAWAYGAVVLLLEPFYVASGFAMYLNRRVELEAWDVEQEFRHALA